MNRSEPYTQGMTQARARIDECLDLGIPQQLLLETRPPSHSVWECLTVEVKLLFQLRKQNRNDWCEVEE